MITSQQKFKQTEIGVVPEDWESGRLGAYGVFKNGINFNRNQFGKGYKVVNVKQLFGGRFVSTDDLEEVMPDVIRNKEYILKKRRYFIYSLFFSRLRSWTGINV